MRVTGEIDMAAVPTLSAALEPHLNTAGPVTDLIVDLSGVTFIDLHGLTLLLAATKTARSRGATLQLAGSPPCLLRLLLLTGSGAAIGVAVSIAATHTRS